MISRRVIKSLKLALSALFFLGRKNGSTHKALIRFLVKKYNLKPEEIKPFLTEGLKKGVKFGIIQQDSGLYRLNNVLSNTTRESRSVLNKEEKEKKLTVKKKQIGVESKKTPPKKAVKEDSKKGKTGRKTVKKVSRTVRKTKTDTLKTRKLRKQKNRKVRLAANVKNVRVIVNGKNINPKLLVKLKEPVKS